MFLIKHIIYKDRTTGLRVYVGLNRLIPKSCMSSVGVAIFEKTKLLLFLRLLE